jgi:hypothetical protein
VVNSSSGEVTRLLAEMEDRKEEAAPRLYELLYHELRRIAQHHFANDRADHSLQATSLVHGAYMLLVAGGPTIQKIAEVMGAAIDTVKRDWCVAKAWPYGELANGESR